jgi:hypothetical protein
VYPYFSGIYVSDGSNTFTYSAMFVLYYIIGCQINHYLFTVGGHPLYVEQDKHTGMKPFVQRKGAVIRYCEEIESGYLWLVHHNSHRLLADSA